LIIENDAMNPIEQKNRFIQMSLNVSSMLTSKPPPSCNRSMMMEMISPPTTADGMQYFLKNATRSTRKIPMISTKAPNAALWNMSSVSSFTSMDVKERI